MSETELHTQTNTRSATTKTDSVLEQVACGKPWHPTWLPADGEEMRHNLRSTKPTKKYDDIMDLFMVLEAIS